MAAGESGSKRCRKTQPAGERCSGSERSALTLSSPAATVRRQRSSRGRL